ncbi:hypothetical protein QJQ45_015854 [Haematococcus lacustris]|nr:hypothetical protein QJQ45_015854 [Haematococcus lacustris]
MLDPSDGICSMEEPLLAAQPDGVAHINEEEDDLFRMKELIRELPDDVLHFLADSGVVQLGEMEVAEELVAAAFGPEPLLVVGAEHVGCDWRGMWSAVLEDRGRTQASRQPGGGRCLVQAHAVCLRDAASPGYRGLLQPLLKRYQAHGCPLDVFGLPAVHAVISFKWHTWAHRALVSEMLVYVAWLAAFVAFTLLFEGEEEELPLQALLDSHHGRCTLMCSLVALLAMLPFLYMEVCTMVVYQRGWVNLWNVVDLACYGLQVSGKAKAAARDRWIDAF